MTVTDGAIAAQARADGHKPITAYRDPSRAQGLLKFCDAAALFVSFTILFYQALRIFSEDAALFAAAFVAAELTYVSIMALRWIRIYDIDFLVSHARGTIAAGGIITIAGGSVLLLFDTSLLRLPEGSISSWLLGVTVYFSFSRVLAGMWFRPLKASGAFRQRIAIVGGGAEAERAIATLDASRNLDIEIVGLFDDRDEKRSPESTGRYRKLGKIKDIENYLKTDGIDLIIVTIPMTAHARVMQLLPRLWKLPVEIRICAQALDMKLSPRAYSYLGRLPLLTVFSRPLRSNGLAMKFVLDKCLALLLLGVLSPVFIAAACAVALTSRGPILTRVERIGFDGKPVYLWHFRTRTAAISSKGAGQPTGVGRLLVLTAINELPELLNVLKGDLSIVGPAARVVPAPDEMGEYEKVACGYCLRHGLRPGLVGWAQIHGFDASQGSPARTQNRIQHDLEYVDRRSLLFDLKTLAKSPFASLRNHGIGSRT